MSKKVRYAGTIAGAALRGIAAASLLLGLAANARAELASASAEAIRQALGSGHPTVIDVGARHCVTCRKMAPILETLAGAYRDRAGVLFVDVNENEAAAETFRIQMIPTQIFFDAQGQEVKRHIGFMDDAALATELKSLGVE